MGLFFFTKGQLNSVCEAIFVTGGRVYKSCFFAFSFMFRRGFESRMCPLDFVRGYLFLKVSVWALILGSALIELLIPILNSNKSILILINIF